MDPIKEAFQKIKEDINNLKQELNSIRQDINNIKIDTQTHIQTLPTQNNTYLDTYSDTSTGNNRVQTHNNAVESSYTPDFNISIGNEGVPTNIQTYKQTPQQTQNMTNLQTKTEFQQANEILDSLDEIKKEIRLKFKRLTSQEMLVFSHLYALEEQKYEEITYKTIAQRMSLSESSIRDYINKLINKGIPIKKARQNNKTILLSVSKDLKNIANLATIQSLRQI